MDRWFLEKFGRCNCSLLWITYLWTYLPRIGWARVSLAYSPTTWSAVSWISRDHTECAARRSLTITNLWHFIESVGQSVGKRYFRWVLTAKNLGKNLGRYLHGR